MLTTKVLRTIQRYAMMRAGDRVLVGLSGGPDSVVLTDMLVELEKNLGIELFVAHFNHGMRAEADDDESFCRELASAWRLPFVAGRTDVAERARSAKRSLEDEARRARYAFLFDNALRHRCTRIAVGHNMDDQAETLLMRLARGSGTRGLASAYPVVKKGDISLVRPLIDIRRADIVAHAEERGLAYREDTSNFDRRFTRNRLRHDVLPFVAAKLNPKLIETLARTSELLRDDEDLMEAQARAAFVASAVPGGEGTRLSVAALHALHPALRRRVIRHAVARVHGDATDLTSGHVADVSTLLEEGKSGREIHLPGLVASRSFDEIEFSTPEARRARAPSGYGYNRYEYRLTIPAKLPIKECRGLLTAHLVESAQAEENPCAAAGNAVVVGIEDGISELRVRSPRPSDRFRPLGAPGSKPLARYLMDRKVAKEDRCHVPLVVRGNENEILWVAGHAVSETARLGAGRRRLHLEWMNL